MLLLTVLAGKSAPTFVRLSGTSACIGRGPKHDLCLDDDGVWDRHLQISLDPNLQFLAKCRPETQVVINSETVNEHPLRNGDLIEIGRAKVRFGFTETVLRRYRVREAGSWFLFAIMLLLQVGIIYLLSQLFK
jgi:pSer/pThr/pTyr-binding forkhead associated (FHA) protein